MTRNLKFKTLTDIENEIFILEKCNVQFPEGVTISGIYETIAEQIENSISGQSEEPKFLERVFAKYNLKRTLAKGKMNINPKSFSLNRPLVEEDGVKLSLARLKTALTAFKLHSGPFAPHKQFGELSKDEWTKIHSFFSARLFSEISVTGDDKIRKDQIDREERLKKSESTPEQHKKHYHGHKHYHKNKKHHHRAGHHKHKNKGQ